MMIALPQLNQQPLIQLNEQTMRLEVQISMQLGIDAQAAKRKVTRFLLDEISLFVTPEHPLLVINNSQLVWRFPLSLVMGQQGWLGHLGQLDVDAVTGNLLVDEIMTMEIKNHALTLAQNTSFSANS